MGAVFEFVPFGGAASEPAIACDGLVEGAGTHLSHWDGNRTAPELKADTSVEIAFRFVEQRASDLDEARPVTNNHFDTDGVLAVFTLLEPERALEHREMLIAAAEVGDFDEWPADERGLMLDSAVRVLASQSGDGRDAYAEILPQLGDLLEHIEERSDLWAREMNTLRNAERSANAGALHASKIGRTALLVHRREQLEAPGPLLSRLAGSDVTRWLLAFEESDGRFSYRYERPRYAWADTVQRPRIAPPSRNAIARDLGDGWTLKGGPGMTDLIRTVQPIALAPEAVIEALHRYDHDAR